MRPSLVIFDCDGVLVDSERLAAKSMEESLRMLGLDMTYAEIRRELVGLSWNDTIIKIEERLGSAVPEDWPQRAQQQDRERFLSDLQAVAGVRSVIDRLRSEAMPYCVASSGEPSKMNATLGATDMLHLFEGVMFSATMVKRGKPHPDIFLYAAEQMGHGPDGCVVIEDSVYGVRAGRAAGMRVFAYTGDPHSDEKMLAEAGGEPFADMADLPRLLGLV